MAELNVDADIEQAYERASMGRQTAAADRDA